MKKYFVVSDVHGFYDELMKALKEAGYDKNNPDHIFVSCGDLFDRGPKAVECLKFVNGLSDEKKILISGNHEDLLIDIFDRGYFEDYDVHNRTNFTCYQLLRLDKSIKNPEKVDNLNCIKRVSELKQVQKYLNSLINYYELDDYIFVHGWIPSSPIYNIFIYNPDWRNATKEEWLDAKWTNGYDAWQNKVDEDGKTIVCGHINTGYAYSTIRGIGEEFGEGSLTDIFYDEGIIGLDACTVYSKKINCLVIEK